MKILGVDASTRCTGWCVLDNGKLIEYGKIIPEDRDAEWRERVLYMMRKVGKIAQTYNIDTIACETPVKTIKNVNTLEQLFTLGGTLMGIAAMLHINYCPVEVATWRKHFKLLDGIPAKEKDKRAILKQRSIELANETYNLELQYVSPSSSRNDDDIADSINIATYVDDVLNAK